LYIALSQHNPLNIEHRANRSVFNKRMKLSAVCFRRRKLDSELHLRTSDANFAWSVACIFGRNKHSLFDGSYAKFSQYNHIGLPCYTFANGINNHDITFQIPANWYNSLLLRLRTCEVLWWVCLSVGLSVCPTGYLRNHTRDLYQFFVHVACVRGSVLLRHVYDKPVDYSSPLRMHYRPERKCTARAKYAIYDCLLRPAICANVVIMAKLAWLPVS